MPCTRYAAATANVPRAAAISTQGCDGWTSVVECAPSRVWTRTSTSVIVPCKPTNSMRLPPRPPGAVMIRRSTIESGSSRSRRLDEVASHHRESAERPAAACRPAPGCARRRRSDRAASRSARGTPGALHGRSRSGGAQGRSAHASRQQPPKPSTAPRATITASTSCSGLWRDGRKFEHSGRWIS